MTTRNQVILYKNKEVITLKMTRINFYLRSKIIEAWSAEGQVYYLFFYKNTFLTACKAKRIKLRSFIEDSFKKGITFEPPHPIALRSVHSTQPYKVPDSKQLLKKLHNHFSPYEKAFILTFFESFFPKKELYKQIQEIYYHFRRNGQMFASYQIIRILHEFAPKNSWAKQTANLIEYTKYSSLYREYSNELLNKDVISGERLLYNMREKKNYLDLLKSSLLADGCVLDAAALAIEHFLATPEKSSYQILLERLHMVFSEEEVCEILSDLSSKRPGFPMLQKDLLEKLLNLHRYEEATRLLAEGELPPSALSHKAFDSIVELILFEAPGIHYERLNTFLIPLVHSDPEKAEKVITKCVVLLMKEYDIDYVVNWLAPIKACNPSLSIFEKVEHMKNFKDDPDKQLDLGKLYYEFKLFDQALDCFSWEMELDAANPMPVEWLAKIYKEMGLEHESQAYVQLLENEGWYVESPN